MISVAPLPPGVSVVEVPAPAPPSADTLSRIDAIWQDEQKRRSGRITDGRIFSVSRRDGATFKVWQSQYKWWIAQRRDPTLFPTLALRPLAVSGIVRLAEGLVFARRAESNTQDPGLWELPPSGSIDETSRQLGGAIDAEAQILAELEEELAVSPEALDAPPQAAAMMADDVDHVIDIVFALSVSLSASKLLAGFAAMANREYTAVRVLDARNAVALLAREGGLSPASAALLAYLSARG